METFKANPIFARLIGIDNGFNKFGAIIRVSEPN
jgi:hypothetical protein